MSFKNTMASVNNGSMSFSESLNREELSYFLAVIQGEKDERRFERLISKQNSNLEALDSLNEAQSELTALQEEYDSLKIKSNLESLDSDDLDKTKILLDRTLNLSKKIGVIAYANVSNNFEDMSVNLEGIFAELGNELSQGFSTLAVSFSKTFKAIGTVFSSSINHRRKKLLALKYTLNEVNKFDIPKQVNDDFVESYLCMLKLSDYNVEKTFAQIDPLQDYVKSMMSGKYPDGSRGIGAKIDMSIPEIRDRAEEIKDFTTYRNYYGMKLSDVICVGYQNKGESIRAFINFEFRVPKANITKAAYSFRDFNNVSYNGIKIIDGSDAIIRVMQNVIIGFRNDRKVIKFDKSLAIRQIDAEISRVDKIASIIIRSNWQDIVKSFQSFGTGIATAFEKAIPMGVGREINVWMDAASAGILGWFIGMVFGGNTFSRWIAENYYKAYSGLIEMSKANYNMLVDYCNAIIDNQK